MPLMAVKSLIIQKERKKKERIDKTNLYPMNAVSDKPRHKMCCFLIRNLHHFILVQPVTDLDDRLAETEW